METLLYDLATKKIERETEVKLKFSRKNVSLPAKVKPSIWESLGYLAAKDDVEGKRKLESEIDKETTDVVKGPVKLIQGVYTQTYVTADKSYEELKSIANIKLEGLLESGTEIKVGTNTYKLPYTGTVVTQMYALSASSELTTKDHYIYLYGGEERILIKATDAKELVKKYTDSLADIHRNHFEYLESIKPKA